LLIVDLLKALLLGQSPFVNFSLIEVFLWILGEDSDEFEFEYLPVLDNFDCSGWENLILFGYFPYIIFLIFFLDFAPVY